MNKRWLLSFSCSLSLFFSSAQEFGGIPSSLKWKQVNTASVKVIFPAGLEGAAMRVASISDLLDSRTASTIGDKKRKISIVLQSETTISNGYVQMAPWRSEFFMTPMQNSLRLGSISWTDQLAIHEFRHVQQYMNFRKGLSKFAYFIAGEEGQLLANSAAIPDWFFEGDAVFQETYVTGQGRGRLPSFYSEFRSLWEAGRNYSYMKLRNGSFRHLTPDHYSLGYLLVAYGREKYGDDVWRKVTQDAAAFKPLFYPMQGAVKKHTGVSFNTFVKNAFSHYRESALYRANNEAQQLTTPSEQFQAFYAFPQYSADTTIVLKSTGRDIPRFVMMDQGKEKKLFTKDIGIDDQFSFKKGRIVYASYKPDLRWGYRDYSNLRVVDLRTGKRSWLTKKSKLFSPDLSHDGEQVVAVDVKPGGSSSVQILDAVTGLLLKTYVSDDGSFITYPKFSKDDKALFMPMRRADGRMSIVKWDIASGESKALFPFTYQAIAFPSVKGDTLFFTVARNGQDKLMAWDDKSGQLFEVLNRYTGVRQATPLGNGDLLYSGRSAWGDLLYRSKAEHRPISEEQWVKGNDSNIYVPKALHSAIGIEDMAANNFEVRKYKKGLGLFNFHSWRPYYDQPEWSFSIYGNNVLNTFNSTLGYVYNENESFHKVEYTGTYSAWFPWIEGGASYTYNRRFQGTQRSIYWNEVNANLGFRIPLNFTGGRLFTNMYVSSLFNIQNVMFNDEKNGGNIPDLQLNYLDNSFAFATQIQKAEQQIFPRFAFTTFANYRGSVNDTEARQFLVNANLFLPGALKTHSLVLSGSYQARDTAQQYLFTNNFPLSRGYPGVNYPRMWKAAVNYHLPLFYPDMGVANIVYFLRVRANLFYDYSSVKSLRTGISQPLRSAGAEIFFDTRWWNQQPVSFGVRYSRLFDTDLFNSSYSSLNPNQWEFVLPINLIPR